MISAIDGMAGIGKTALAVHAAHRLSGRFPGGQLFIDLHGYTKGQPPREPGEALEAFLRALGVPAGQIPQETEERAALYRQRLAGTRTLIVLDNASDEAQVRPLLPGEPGCLVLVTSRRRLKGLDDARSLALDLLPPQDAVALLRAVAGAGRIAAGDPLLGEIAGLCGRLPLALRIAGALLRHRPAWSLGHLAGLLRDQQHRVRALSDGERDLAAVFDLSYAGLDEPHRLLFRRLGLVPGPDVDAYAAAALLECDPDGATALLEDLVDHNLLTEHARAATGCTTCCAPTPAPWPRPTPPSAAGRRWTGCCATTPTPRRGPPSPSRARHGPAGGPARPTRPHSRTPRPPAPGCAPNTPTWRQPSPTPAPAPPHPTSTSPPWPRDWRKSCSPTAPGPARWRSTRPPPRWPRHRHQPAAHATALTDLGQVRHLTGDLAGAADALARALEICRETGNRHGEAHALTVPGAGAASDRGPCRGR